MDTSNVSAAERARYLKLIGRRAAKLAQLATDAKVNSHAPAAIDFLIARYVHLIMQPAVALMPAHLRAGFIAWYLEQIRDNHGHCTICGKPKLRTQDLACQDCLTKSDLLDAELGLDVLTAEEIRAIADNADGGRG